jgi:hypothetical protein
MNQLLLVGMEIAELPRLDTPPSSRSIRSIAILAQARGAHEPHKAGRKLRCGMQQRIADYFTSVEFAAGQGSDGAYGALFIAMEAPARKQWASFAEFLQLMEDLRPGKV